METESFDQGLFKMTEKGHCVDISFYNIEASGVARYDLDLGGHIVTIIPAPGKEPDTFFVEPLSGWEAVTQNPLSVQEWTESIITLCQMLLG